MGHHAADREGAGELRSSRLREDHDTIAAVATATGRGGIGIVRVSGPAVRTVALGILGAVPQPRSATVRGFRDASGDPIDRGVALFFPAPASYTGEDILELQGHGGPVVLDLLLARVLDLGARPARPGEFTERAFLNGRMDLAQAEAVADLIDSVTTEAARGARRCLDGALSNRVQRLRDGLADLRIFPEAEIDFPEDEVGALDTQIALERLTALRNDLDDLLRTARQGQLLREGLMVVIAGRPNVGKSSLLNALAGHEVAIVTDVPGTTRDLVHARVELDGLPVHLVDTAGLRTTDDPVERIGVDRAWTAARTADAVVLVVDAEVGYGAGEAEIAASLPEEVPRLIVWNKIDRTGLTPAVQKTAQGHTVYLSARTGAGVSQLQQALREQVGYAPSEGLFTARRRHLQILRVVRDHLHAAERHLGVAGSAELLAEELRQAQNALGEITGAVSTEELLDRVFSHFCIGK